MEFEEKSYNSTRYRFKRFKCREKLTEEDVPNAEPGVTDWHKWVYGGFSRPEK